MTLLNARLPLLVATAGASVMALAGLFWAGGAVARETGDARANVG